MASEAQQDEMMALESILDPATFQFSSAEFVSGQLQISIQVPEDFHIIDAHGPVHTVEYLPPLVLHFTLPKEYPELAEPSFTLTSSWLNRADLSTLCHKLDEIYQENKCEILYTWYAFLKEEALSTLEMKSYSIAPSQQPKSPGPAVKKDQRAVFDPAKEPMLQHLLDYDREESHRIFSTTSLSCPICLLERMGSDCIKLNCGHAFCTQCATEYWSGLITEGKVDAVMCLTYNCGSGPSPEQVKTAVGEELYARYDELLLARTLDNMSDVLFCPLRTCQCPVLADPTDKLANCPRCHYVFCSACKAGYHGVEPCRFKTDEKRAVFEKYTSGSEDEKLLLEKRYGKRQLGILVDTVLSEKWVNSRSKPCPHCAVPIEKFEGCNKVTCFKCSTYFCWICHKQLDVGNPYSHFNNPTSPCYNSLFRDDDRDEDDTEDDDSDFEFDDYDSEESSD